MPYIGEIRMFGGNFAPAGWMFCEGQTLAISENDFLFTLIGTTYGGDGETTFNLPDLRGRLPIHQGQGSGLASRILAENGGIEATTLTTQQLPVHTHPLAASSAQGTLNSPIDAVPAQGPTVILYREIAPNAGLLNTAVAPAGGSQPHDNLQPYLCISFIISLFGVFPTQT